MSIPVIFLALDVAEWLDSSRNKYFQRKPIVIYILFSAGRVS